MTKIFDRETESMELLFSETEKSVGEGGLGVAFRSLVHMGGAVSLRRWWVCSSS